MRFGPVPVEQSVGAVVAHGVRAGSLLLKKGEVVQAAHLPVLRASGVSTIVVASLDPGDVTENDAARRLADAAIGRGLRVDTAFTGRANIFAEANGVIEVDVAALDRLNAIDESLTIATLPPLRAVQDGEMVATVKVIPFAVPGSTLRDALAAVGAAPLLQLAPFRPLRVAVVSTLLPGLKPSVIDKTLRVLDERLAAAGATIASDERVPHGADALDAALRRALPSADLIVVFGASAIADRRDVIPAAIVAAGGEIRHFGMPVDPGNLLLLGRLDGKPVIGAPGCARSPKENGFDWVLQRLLAGLDVTPEDIRRMGAGGLLMEIVSRPHPRLGDTQEARFAAAERVA